MACTIADIQPFNGMPQAAALEQLACQRILSVLDSSQQYADQLLQHVDCHGTRTSQHRRHVEGRKRKRASPYSGSNEQLSQQFAQPGTPTQELLPTLQGELRHHQLLGVKWLASLYMNGLNGIMSDELEHDRQVQIIGLLAYLHSKGVGGPFIIVTSSSSLACWAARLQQLLPEAKVHNYSTQVNGRAALSLLCGSPQDALLPHPPVMLISHDDFITEHKQLSRQAFRYMAMDAPGKRSMSQKLLALLKAFPVCNMVLLTGSNPTHVESVDELWPLLQLVLPDVWEHVHHAVQELTMCEASPCSVLQSFNTIHTMADITAKLQAVIDRFVLHRSAEEVNIGQPRRVTECNLYDYFGSADNDLDT